MSFVESLAGAVRTAVAPLEADLADQYAFQRLLVRHGWNTSIDPATMPAISAAFGLETLFQQIASLADQLSAGGGDAIATQLRDALANVFDALLALGASPPAGGGLPFPFDQSSFWQEMPLELADELLVDLLEADQPILFSLLFFVGVVAYESRTPTGPGRIPYRRTTLRWEMLESLLGGPAQHLRQLYRWGGVGGPFDHQRLIEALERTGLAFRLPVRRDPPRPELRSSYYAEANPELPHVTELALPILSGTANDGSGFIELGLLLLPIPTEGDPTSAPAGLLLAPIAQGYVGASIPVAPNWSVAFAGGFDADEAFGIEVYPEHVSLKADPGAVEIDASAALVGRGSPSWVVLGSPDSSRLELPGVLGQVRVHGHVADPELIVELATGSADPPPPIAFVLQFAEGDSFLNKIFGTNPQRFEFGGRLRWSSKKGFTFNSAAAATFLIPLNVVLGPAELQTLVVAITASGSNVTGIVALTGAVRLGPVVAVVDRVGVQLTLDPPSAGKRTGVVGGRDLSFGFKSPNGVGLSIDAAAVTGGGFLFHDEAKAMYAGALHLEFEGISLNAIGLLTTKMPDGSQGFSLLVIVTAAGFTPIQLGFGFTLNGVGGLLGVNRTTAVEVLRAGIKSKALDAILFSKDDPTPRAAEIVSTLQNVFPPAPSRYVFGPMAELGWGTPTVITLELAVLLELPSPVRLIVLGRLRAVLPDEQTAIVKITMDALGVIDFDARTAAVDATLYDSFVGPFALTGDMALRAAWGDKPAFALAVGGFHPQFHPPAGFPQLKRLTLSLSTGDNPRLRAELYLALTSNTVQVGAHLDFAYSALGFTLEGLFGFDALINLDPFSFEVDIAAHLALKRGSTTIVGLDVKITLTGPSPWRARGEASFSILFFSISIPFDVTFGDTRQVPPPARVEVWPLLRGAILDGRNWSARLPPESGRMASFGATPPAAGEALVHPLGTLAFEQRVVPLERNLDLFGPAPPKDFGRFEIATVVSATVKDTVYDYFAPAQFIRMSDAEKLSRPSFDRMPAGVELGGAAPAFGAPKTVPLTYETIVVADGAPPAAPAYVPPQQTVADQAEFGPAGSSEARSSGRATFRAPGAPVALQDPDYVLATRDGLQRVDPPQPTDGSVTSALEALHTHLLLHPEDEGVLQVVRRQESVA